MEEAVIEADYNPFMVNRFLSYSADAVLLVNEINKQHSLSKYDQYLFYYHGLTKRHRSVKYIKVAKNNSILSIQTRYNYNHQHALSAMHILTEEQLNEIQHRQNHGKDNNGTRRRN